MSHGHAAIVLAAGGSRRLGRPKQLLPRAGAPLLRHVLDLVASTRPLRAVLILGGHRDAIRAALGPALPAPFEAIEHAGWDTGLAGSLACAARALADHAGPVLIVGSDQPALNALHLRALLDGAAQVASRCAAVLHGDRPGIPAVVSPALLATAAGLQGDRGFGAGLAALPEAELFRLHAPLLGHDLDSEDDVRVAIAQGWLDADA
ncbi:MULTISPECIES: nucleotidyltransferase family protein [Luteimonas]|uniref:nucleotidyltransferase family protein n=1 Tax=Luteimonas TaxID=83614 RepID=UPI000C7C17B9|nr:MULTISPECIES: nucleotidyltransferase family protein [Luteimonas]